MENMQPKPTKGINAALASALFLGLAPVFGKLAITLGLPPLAVVAIRTVMASFLVFIVVLIYKRAFIYIYPAGLLGCFLAGGINGLGSLFYYAALGKIDASLGQIIYSLYPMFVAIWLWLDHQSPSRLTIIRLVMVLPALYLLVGSQEINLVGVGMMLIASALYALHLPINQRVLYDMPAPTVTLYTLLAMSAVVVPAFIISFINKPFPPPNDQSWGALLALTLITFSSRLTLFLGVKHLGGQQTALLGLSELMVTIIFSHLWLQEHMSLNQWLGLLLLALSLVLVRLDKSNPRKSTRSSWLNWINPSAVPSEIPWQPHD